jgi:ComF family protein
MFDGPLRLALHKLKYQQDMGLGDVLSRHLIYLVNGLAWDMDVIIPVPLSDKRLSKRGYNQAALLAHPIALNMKLPYLPKALRRTRETSSQVGLSIEERRENVDGAFMAKENSVGGRSVLVVDDVITTGATLNAIAKALKNGGADRVYGLTLARAPLE